MSTLTIILTLLVALEHLYIMFLETVATRSQHTSKTFSIEKDELGNHHISTLLKNQGVYNGLLAILLVIAVVTQDLLWTRMLLGYVILVALYGSLTSKPSVILKQGGVAICALIVSFL
jgi:putative membrane protein